ncbi:MAG: hypothetical protein ACLFSA_00535 [Spirochaetaceae bacterium]
MGDLKTYGNNKKSEVRRNSRSWDRSTIDRVALDLERYGYEPGIFFPVPGFASYTKEDMIEEIDGIINMDEEEVQGFALAEERTAEEIKKIAIDMLTAQFLLLERLRAGEPEAWDEIHELYEDD